MKILRTLALTATLALTGCAGSLPSSVTPSSVQAIAAQICGWVPLAIDVASFLTANPLIASAEQVATALCSALPQSSSLRGVRRGGKAAVVVNGVRVRGQYVR